jgi:hypothetical protein
LSASSAVIKNKKQPVPLPGGRLCSTPQPLDVVPDGILIPAWQNLTFPLENVKAGINHTSFDN